MNLNYNQEDNKRLHSPLLDGKIKKNNSNIPNQNIQPAHDKSLSTLHIEKKKSTSIKSSSTINLNLISFTESIFNIASIFILATGGLVSVLELVSIVRIIYSGSNNYSINLICFAIAFIGTIIAMMLCLGIVQIIKTIKIIYLNLDEQNSKIDYVFQQFSNDPLRK